MKQIGLLFIAIIITNSLWAKEHVPTKEDYNAFLKTKTLVVMDPNPMSDFNFKIKEVMKNHWTITEYEFIDEAEFEQKRGDSSYSFLVTTVATFSADKTKARYNFLSLLMGETDVNIADLPDLCSIPLSYLRVEDDSYAYKMDGFIRFIQDHVTLMQENPELIKANVFKHYNKNIQSLKTKTLLLVKEDLEKTIRTQQAIEKIYPYNVKLVTQAEVTKAIENKDDSAVFLHKVGPEGTKYRARCYKIIMGAADSKFYYFDYHMISKKAPDGLLEKDLKRMGSR